MKLLASLIIAVSLVIGVIGATTAYLVPLDYLEQMTFADEQPEGLHVNANAGLDPADPTGRTPLATRGDTITPELIQALRQQDVARINVNQFFFWGWLRGGGLPLFLVGALGLLGGAMLLRRANRALLIQQPAGSAAHDGTGRVEPEVHFEAIRAGITQLKAELPGLTDREKYHAIMETFGHAQRTHIPAFVAMRPQLIARLGLGGYAQFMDSFAAAERQLNRAWSAAADEVLDEALERVETAAMLFDEAAAKLR